MSWTPQKVTMMLSHAPARIAQAKPLTMKPAPVYTSTRTLAAQETSGYGRR